MLASRGVRGRSSEKDRGIPEDQRQIIELAYYSGRTQAEIGAMLKLPLSTVKSRARLGLLTLRGMLISQPQAPP